MPPELEQRCFWDVFVEIQQASTELDNIQRAIADERDNDDHFELKMNQIVKINGLLARRQALKLIPYRWARLSSP